jgi:hypothetical protein
MAQSEKWLKSWQEKYQPLLVEGLSDGPTYVRLATKSLDMLDVVVALRPVSSRINAHIIMIGAKLSVFPVIESLKVDPANKSVLRGWLLEAYPHVVFPKQDHQRLGTVFAAGFGAPYDEGTVFLEEFKKHGLAEKLIHQVEEMLGTPVEDAKQVIRAVSDAYAAQLPLLFKLKQGPKEPVYDGSNVIQFKPVLSIDNPNPPPVMEPNYDAESSQGPNED